MSRSPARQEAASLTASDSSPAMTSRKGRMLWYPMVVVYWSLAFVIGSAIPAIGALSGLGMLQSSLRSNPQTRAYSFFSVAAVCIFHFTYTFPPAMMLGLDIAIDAASAEIGRASCRERVS